MAAAASRTNRARNARKHRRAETAANHLYAHGFVELWGQGSLAVTGTVNFLGTPTYLAVVGGTGAYAASSGQCTLISGDTTDSWSCDIQ